MMTRIRFEEEVAALYRLMGYEVEVPRTGSDGGVDLVISYAVPGVDPVKFFVECKRTGPGKRLPASILSEIGRRVRPFRKSSQGLLLVTDGIFSEEAQKIAMAQDIKCIPIADLRADALKMGPYLNGLTANPLSEETKKVAITAVDAARDARAPALGLLAEWADDNEDALLLLLGGPGTGKSSVCHQLAFEMAEAAKTVGRIPVILPGHKIGEEGLADLFFDTVSPKLKYPPALLSQMQFFLIIVDGFDEIALDRRAPALDELAQLADRAAAKILVTSRSLPELETSRFSRARRLTLQPISRTEIEAYLQQAWGKLDPAIGGGRAEDILRDQRFMELLRTPLFLRIFANLGSTLFGLPALSGFSLFDEFVLSLLSRYSGANSQRQRSLLIAIARHMHSGQRDTVAVTEVFVDEIQGLDQAIAASIIRRDGNTLCFTHAVLRDYFVAAGLIAEINRCGPKILAENILSPGVVRFMTAVSLDPRLVEQAQSREGGLTPTQRANILALTGAQAASPRPKIPGIRLRRLVLSNIKCFTEINLEFPGDYGPGGLAVLVGENGHGKSTLLQAIVICALGPEAAARVVPKPDSLLRAGTKSGVIKADFLVRDGEAGEREISIGLRVTRGSRLFELVGKDDPKENTLLAARIATDFTGLFVAAYGPWRHFDFTDDPATAQGQDSLIDRVCSLFDPRKLLVHPRSLARLMIGDGAPFRELGAPVVINHAVCQRVTAILRSLLPSEEAEGFTVDGLYEGMFGEYPIGELSDGYRSTLAWAGHLIAHLLATTGWSEHLEDVHGILLVDELDLHLHPKWQRTILDCLQRAFPSLQLIVTTHSPLVVGSASSERGEIVLLRRVGREVRKVEEFPSVHGLRADQILASELFGFLIDADPRTERVLKEASVLAGKGRARTPQEERRYQEVIEELKGVTQEEGQTLVERDVSLARRKEVAASISRLEAKLFKGKL